MKSVLLFSCLLSSSFACATLPDRKEEEQLVEFYWRAQQEPNNLDLQLTLGDLLAKRGYSDGAIEVWQAALNRSSNEQRFLRRIADLQFAIGKDRQAIESYQSILQQSAGDVELFYHLGWSYLKIQEPAKALEYMEKVKLTRPRETRGYLGVGSVHLALHAQKTAGALEAALAAFRQALLVDDKDALALFYMAYAYALNEDWELAKQFYRGTIANDPNNPAPKENLALLYLRSGDSQAARPLLQQALRLEQSEERRAKIQEQLQALN